VKVPVSWLRDYVAIDVPLEVLAAKLVISGLEVDRIVTRGAPDTGANHEHFRIGRVLEFGKHPNADRLRLCRVDVGEPEPRQIVCGASNFHEGDTVVVALPGSLLPGSGEPLRRAKLRGEVSDGMMLSERELQLSEEHDGIIRLPGSTLEIGSLARDHFALEETILELEVTSNRADLLSVYGIAREVAALLDVELAQLPGTLPAATGTRPTTDVVRVAIDAPDACLRFTARAFDGIVIGPSPLRIRQRLSASGMRPISNVVDVTNYVMIGLGNPTHAYDAATIHGGALTARHAQAGETITTLDGKHRTLDGSMLVIADAIAPSGLAGIMGSEGSEIAATTSTVVLEAANFERAGIQRTCQALALRTDGAGRWMRGVDPHLAPQASVWGAELLVAHARAQMLPGDLDVVAHLPGRDRIVLRTGRAEAVLGMPIADADAAAILGRLGYEPETVADGVAVRVPTWRALDTPREIDLVEEVGRIHGLEKLPATIPSRSDGGGGLTRSQALRRRVEDALAGLGLQESYTVSLVDTASLDEFGMAPDDERRGMVALSNPLSPDFAYLRRTLLPSLVRAVRRNRASGRGDVALFEIAHVYDPPPGGITADDLGAEPWTLAAVLSGRLGGTSWAGAGVECDFFVAKGVLEAIGGRLGIVFTLTPSTRAYLHPGRAATVRVDDVVVGEIGELHPAVAERLDIDGRVSLFEIDLDLVAALLPAGFTYRPVPDQPPVRQDIAVIVPDDVAAGSIVAAALGAGAPLLSTAEVFDVYRDEARLGAGRVSLAIRLVFQHPERTLTEDEASAVRVTVTDALTARFGAELRG
jgi:phenylalanyl-tRNA synthetase beta chain